MPDALALALGAILPPGAALGLADPTEPVRLWPGERLQNAVPKRVAEFSAGRAAARRAMATLGLPPAAIAMGADRAPVWPLGLTGTISHCPGACMAVVASSDDYAGLGLDLEPDVPLPAEIWTSILRPAELQLVTQQTIGRQGHMALQIFVAKEAVYKAQYGTTRCLFDFHTLEITLQDHRFTSRFVTQVDGLPEGMEVSGTLVSADGFIAAFVALPAFIV